MVQIRHPLGRVVVDEIGGGRRRVWFEPAGNGFVSCRQCETRYPVALVERMVELKGPVWLCDEIRREEDPRYVARPLLLAIESRLAEEELRGKRLLDFGCGSGASTLILGRTYRDLEVVGVDLERSNVELARERARFLDARNLRFEQCPDPESLPDAIGSFDIIVLSAVWEHLLPTERRTLACRLWSVLNPQGMLFVNQTPNRWNVLERHTTGLPLINFTPDRFAAWAANRLSSRIGAPQSWTELLRGGIRGGTEREVVERLQEADPSHYDAAPVPPARLGIHDAVDLWYASARHAHSARVARTARTGFRLVARLFGLALVPHIDVAVRKVPYGDRGT